MTYISFVDKQFHITLNLIDKQLDTSYNNYLIKIILTFCFSVLALHLYLYTYWLLY
ncbi:hypothetical protein [Hoylesella timonensis]|uniref:hypothetical protein n=1 Tax=Hoylesella timonensis TaxID=386414 RepID=UPI001E4F8158|nr:hypothetical protein [Hoylesella timonensis]